MYEGDITFLMEYCQRDLGYAQGLIVKGDYAKSIGESYYAVFYAAKAGLLHLGIRSKSHQSVQAGIDSIVERELLSPALGNLPAILLNMRNEAVYRFARRDWNVHDATNCLTMARGFVEAIEAILATS